MIELNTFHQNSLIKMSHGRVVILMSSIYIYDQLTIWSIYSLNHCQVQHFRRCVLPYKCFHIQLKFCVLTRKSKFFEGCMTFVIFVMFFFVIFPPPTSKILMRHVFSERSSKREYYEFWKRKYFSHSPPLMVNHILALIINGK